jgi:ABC-type branched-subunit amino acid transport system substrate-binding protein
MLNLFSVLMVLAFFVSGAQAQLLIGQTAGYTGIVGPGVKETADGARLYIDAINAKGGVLGQKIELISMDDKFEPKLAAENARILIEEKNVLAMFMGRGTPPTDAVIPVIDKFGVPYIAPSTGAISMHTPVLKHIFNVRAPYQAEGILAVKHLTNIGITKIAVIHVDDTFGKDGLGGVLQGFEDVKSKAMYVDKYDRTKPDFSAIAPKAGKEQPQAIVFVGSGGALTQCLKALRAAGSNAQIVTLSNNAAGAFIKQLGDDGRGVIVTQVFPGERTLGHPFINEAAVLARAKNLELTPSMVEGFAGAKVLVEALKRAGPKPTREKLQQVLENFAAYDLGGKLVVEFSPTNHTGLRYADLSIIGSDGKFRR